MLLQQSFKNIVSRLKQSEFVENPTLDSKILLQYLLNISDITFITEINKIKLDSNACLLLENLVLRRLKGEPIAYIVGYKDFWKNTFKVNNSVLIPRADTETLIIAMLQEVDICEPINILEIGVGSGCVLLSLLLEYKNAKGVGTDISTKSLMVAKKNAEQLKIKNYSFVNANLYEGLKGRFHVIVSNPPYIAIDDKNISASTKAYEPYDALYAKDNGLFFLKQILCNAKNYLYESGKIFLEIGFSQTEDMEKILKLYNYTNYKFIKDLAGINRVLYIKV